MWGEQSTDLKSLFFEIYAAGFEAGMQEPKIDIVSAYNQFFENVMQPTLNEIAKKESES